MFREGLVWCNEHDMTRNGDWKTLKAMQQRKQTRQLVGSSFILFFLPIFFIRCAHSKIYINAGTLLSMYRSRQ